MSIYGFALLFLLVQSCVSQQNETDEKDLVQLGEKRLSEYVTAILDHYKQKDPIGIPLPIPDPLDVPPMSHAVTMGKMYYKNVQVHGVSKMQVDHVLVDLVDMKTEAVLQIDELNITGNYTLSTWFSTKKGPFSITLTDVNVTAMGKLGLQEDGALEAQEIDTDFVYGKLKMDFKDLDIVNSAGDFVFQSAKPYMLRELNANIMSEINDRIRALPQKFAGNATPLDQLMARARENVGAYYDPLKVDDCIYGTSIFEIRLTHIWLSGLSTFHRVGNVTFEIRNGTVRLDAKMGTKKLKGNTHWEIRLMGGSRMGTATFSVEYIKIRLILTQALNTNHHPRLDDVDLEFGDIQMSSTGIGDGFLDQGVKIAANIIPNLLRQQIADVLAVLIKHRMSSVLENIKVDKLILDNLSKLDELQERELQGLLT